MIKFFRHIRQSLIIKNQTGRYLKYAIGEIILVVIGILMALQVNNLNEKRKVTNEMTKKIEALVENLENEIKVSGIQFHPKRIEDFQKLLDGKFTMDSLRLNPIYAEHFSHFRTRLKDDVLEENIDILIENEDRLPKDYKEIIGLMKSLKFYFLNYKKSIDDIKILRRNQVEFLENNFDWYALQDDQSNNKRFQYFLNDPLYRNRLHTFIEDYKLSYRIYATVIVRKLQILLAIKLLDKNFSANDLRGYLTSDKFRQNTDSFLLEANKISCEKGTNTKLKVPSSHIIINLSKDTLEIDEPHAFSMKFVPPNQSGFQINRFDNVIKIKRPDKCEAFEVTPLNFIIIE